MEYSEENFLLLSGIQHFAFCCRQWALIHVENQWNDNYRTTDGQLFHKKAHDISFSEMRNDCLSQRAVRIFSHSLGITGECDVLEFRRCDEGISLNNREGSWQPYPIEYKRGQPNRTEGDELQLCAQALCLEEMLCCDIPKGALYYGETRHREEIEFSNEQKEKVRSIVSEMHKLFAQGYTPKVKPHKGCGACSLKELCLPKIQKIKSVSSYLKEVMDDP